MDQDLLHKILRGDALTETEQAWWEAHKEDTKVQKEMRFLEHLSKPLQLENRKILKAQLQKIDRENTTKEDSHASLKPMQNRRMWSVAAGIALLVAAGIMYLSRGQSDLTSEYFAAYPSILSPVVKGGTTSVDDREAAIVAYQNGDYAESLLHFENLSVLSDTLQFYKANTLLALEKDLDAIQILHSLGQVENRFQKESAWFEALALLRVDEKNQARELLERISADETHPYYTEGTSLLRKIK